MSSCYLKYSNGSPWIVKIQTSYHNFQDPVHPNHACLSNFSDAIQCPALHSRKLTCFPFLTHARLLSASPALGPLNSYSFFQQCYSLVLTSPSYPLSHHLICLFHSIQQNLKLFYMCIFLFIVSFSTRMSLYKGFVMFYFISSLPKSTPRAE